MTELLSPAGSIDSFYAALAAGADAVYAGYDKYGARAYAENFTADEMVEAIKEASLLKKKLYLTLNTLMRDDELEAVIPDLDRFYQAGLHGVIVQDLGLMDMILKRYPELDIHASTQAAVCSAYGASYLKSLGIKRVVLSRELSLDEIKNVRMESDIELEVFIHGAMCYSYSGLCLMSSFFGGRSGNRGRCAGPCRQPYSLSVRPGECYPLSMKDLCGLEALPELMELGIESLKIEGRMKPPAYVYAVTSLYRKYMDMYMSAGKKGFVISPEDRDALEGLYSRGGGSTGYFYRKNGPEMLTIGKGSYKSSPPEEKIPRPRLKASARAVLRAGSPMLFTAACGNFRAEKEGLQVQKASNRPVSREDVLQRLKKSGNSSFSLEEIELDMDDGIFIPLGAVNALRREVLDSLREEMLRGTERTL